MALFRYLAVDQEGKPRRGSIHAGSVEEVAENLKSQHLTIVDIAEESEERPLRLSLGRGIGLQEKINFTRHLAVMLEAGLPLVGAIEVLQKDTPNRRFREILAEARTQLEAGKTLSQTFSRYPQYFDETFVSILQAGEVSGKLAQVLASLAKRFEQEQDLRSKIVSALIYPAVVVFGLFLVGMLMVVFVVPRVTTVFTRMNLSLPFTLRLMTWISRVVTFNYYLTGIGLVGGLVLLYFGLRWFWRTELRSKITNRLPVVAQIVHLVDLTNLTATLALLIESGVPIVKSLQIATKSVNNLALKKVLSLTEKGVKQGKSLAEGLRKAPPGVVPPLLIQIVEVGERTGQLHVVLQRISNFYSREVANRLKNLASLIEPVLMLIIGIGIGIVVVSIIAPIYKLVGQVGK